MFPRENYLRITFTYLTFFIWNIPEAPSPWHKREINLVLSVFPSFAHSLCRQNGKTSRQMYARRGITWWCRRFSLWVLHIISDVISNCVRNCLSVFSFLYSSSVQFILFLPHLCIGWKVSFPFLSSWGIYRYVYEDVLTLSSWTLTTR